MIRIYCPSCEQFQPLGIAEMQRDWRFKQNGVWGDLICTVCVTIITSLEVDEPGMYEFRKVEDHAS